MKKAGQRVFVVLFVLSFGFLLAGERPLMMKDGATPRGIEMAEVKMRKGEPKEVFGPVGNPPITRWVYDDREVIVFEYNRVVDSFIPEE